MNNNATLSLFADGIATKPDSTNSKKRKSGHGFVDEPETGFVTQLRDKITMYINQDTGELQPPDYESKDAHPEKTMPKSRKHKVKAGGPGSGRTTWNPYLEKEIHRASKPFGHQHDPSVEPSNRRSVKEAQENEEWHKGLEEMGVPEGILEAGEEMVEREGNIPGLRSNNEGTEPPQTGAYSAKKVNKEKFFKVPIKSASNMPQTGWQYGKRTLPVGYIPQRTLSGFPSGKGGGRGGLPKAPRPKGISVPNRPAPAIAHPKSAKPPKPATGTGHHLPNQSMTHGGGSGHRLSNPTMKSFADGGLGHVNFDTNLRFHPPSLKKPTHIPTDDPGEKDDKFLDVTKRKSKDTKEQRMKILKRSAPAGSPPLIPAHTTLVAPHTAAYLPGMFGQAVRTRPVLQGRSRLVSKSY